MSAAISKQKNRLNRVIQTPSSMRIVEAVKA